LSAFPSDFILAQFGGKVTVEQQVEAAKVWLAKTVLAQIAAKDPGVSAPITPETANEIQQALQIVELRALDLMGEWRKEPRSDKGIEFREFCSFAFDLRRMLPGPPTVDDNLKKMMVLASTAILGDRTADVRRYFKENPWPVPASGGASNGSWAHRLFHGTADAFLRIVRKDGWADIGAVATRIQELRENQKQFEADYLKQENGLRQTAALELVSFYHLAKAVEVLAMFVGSGEPATAVDEVEFHMVRAMRATDGAGIMELSLLLRWMGAASRAIIRSTIWHQLAAYNDKVTEFKKSLTSKRRTQPMFDLLPPQREAIQDLMNISNRALVVEMPTSSGKTLLAEFRIIQTKVNVAESWIAYLVPTRALVNQVTVRLRRDLSSLKIKVEHATPAIEVDVFEDEILTGDNNFDVLVTTPEKLDLLVRSGKVDLKKRTLGLVILDEAHNIGDGDRGLRSELLLATINRESPDTHFLLLTPFVPNADELAKWLDDERSKSVKPRLSVNWQPNDRLIGLAYLSGHGRNWGLCVKPLHTNKPSIQFAEESVLEPKQDRPVTISQARTSRKKIAAHIARALSFRDCSIVLAYSPTDAWDIANDVAEHQPVNPHPSEKLELVRRFVEAEYGSGFALSALLEKGIGVHHAGISPETRFLLEWLAEENELKTLVATSTLAQGVNFPISSVILATHHKPKVVGSSYTRQPLRPDEFWNIAGRAGRLFQDTLGLVLFAAESSTDSDIEQFVDRNVEHLASALEDMIAETIAKGWELDLRRLVRNDAKWSSFVQFLSHTYRQINDHGRFLADTEMLLRRTYAYQRLSKKKPEVAEQLLASTRAYADQLKKLPAGVASLVDTTGFSPETVMELLGKKQEFQMNASEWSPSQLFRSDGTTLQALVGNLLNIRELNLDTRGTQESSSLSEIINMWVGGKSVGDIAEAQFSTEKDSNRRITECCRMLFQKLTQQASWGIGAIQSMAGVDVDSMTTEQREAFGTLPAMIYYGCNTLEGVLMRTLSVPRGVCVPLGDEYKRAQPPSQGGTRVGKARTWLNSASLDMWKVAAGTGKMTGQDYRNVWLVLNGDEPKFGN
jgi:hypothetical protein